jgi:replicative DNA helicase
MSSIPSASLEAEESVIGAIMLDYENLADVIEKLSPDHFSYESTRLAFTAIDSLHSKKLGCDSLTVGQQLSDSGEIHNLSGGMKYLMDLEECARALNPRPYLRILEEKRQLRHFQAVCSTGLSLSRTAGEGLEVAIDYVQSNALALTAGKKAVCHQGDVGAEWLDIIENHRMVMKSGGIAGYSTGIAALDKRLSGYQSGKLIVIAGRPAMGKSIIAVSGLVAAGLAGNPVYIASLEMPNAEVYDRAVSHLSRIDYEKLQRPNELMTQDDWVVVTNSHAKLQEIKVSFCNEDNIVLGQLKTQIRTFVRDFGKGPAFIDYLQLIQTPSGANNRTNEIGEITRQLKLLAKELQIPIILLSQLNRSLEQRPNKRPMASDLRESGSIEQDADAIVMLYRDEVYNENSEYKGIAEFITVKHRGGKIGTDHAAANLGKMRFDDLAFGWADEIQKTTPKKGRL